MKGYTSLVNRLRCWLALALGAGLSVCARAGPLDLPEFDLRVSAPAKDILVSTGTRAFSGARPGMGLVAPAPALLNERASDSPGLEADSISRSFFDGARRLNARSPAPAFPQKLALEAPLAQVHRTTAPRSGGCFYDDPEKCQWLRDLLNPQDFQPQYILGDELGGRALGLFHPAFGILQGVSDRFYDAMTLHLFAHILPGKFYRDLDRSKKRPDSARIFDEKLDEKFRQTFTEMSDTYPLRRGNLSGRPSMEQYDQWKRDFGGKLVRDAIDAFKDTMLARYRLEQSGQVIGHDAKDARNWSPSFLALAAVGGGGLLWLNGINTPVSAGDFKARISMGAGQRLYKALQDGGSVGRIGGLSLGHKGCPVSFYSDFGVERGRLRGEVYGLRLTNRFKKFPFDVPDVD